MAPYALVYVSRDAVQRFLALLRRAGTYLAGPKGPGSAAHR